MHALGGYERLVQEVKGRENPDIPITFGLLIADYRQQNCKDYILNYIERFDYVSGKYINFYLPGYLKNEHLITDNKISIKGIKYYFDEDVYMDFLYKLEQDFDIEYPYNPVLILLEYSSGNFRFSKNIRIELDVEGADIRKTGELFDEIFKIAQKNVAIEDYSQNLINMSMKNGLLDTIISGINISYISAIHNQNQEVKKYKIR